MKTKVGFPELCANETLLNNYYQNVRLFKLICRGREYFIDCCDNHLAPHFNQSNQRKKYTNCTVYFPVEIAELAKR